MQKKIKKEDGSITVLVLASIFLILIVIVNIYVTSSNKNRSGREAFQKIKEAYGMTDEEMEKAYEELTNNEFNKANVPQLMSGMKKIMFTIPTEQEKGQIVQEGEAEFEEEWYSYNDGKWANAQTEDGSMWVWIPRFAYKITAGDVKIKFLIGTTDEYYDDKGEVQTAKREEDGTTSDYIVHPAFTSKNNESNKELSGIWVAKFKAGYAGENNNAPIKEIKDTEKTYYPTFQGIAYTIEPSNSNEAKDISDALTESGNIYGLSKNTNSHLIKDNELEAILYLIRSEYGSGSSNVYENNVTLSNINNEAIDGNEIKSEYSITGVTTAEKNGQAVEDDIKNINNSTENIPTEEGVYAWNQKSGEQASSTGSIYGIYDFSQGEKLNMYELGFRPVLIAK